MTFPPPPDDDPNWSTWLKHGGGGCPVPGQLVQVVWWVCPPVSSVPGTMGPSPPGLAAPGTSWDVRVPVLDGSDATGAPVWSLPIVAYRTRRYPQTFAMFFSRYRKDGPTIESTLGYGPIKWAQPK